MSNSAAWIHGKGQKAEVGPADSYQPGQGELLVQNHGIAINPVDFKIQDYGIFVQQWPVILGSDIAGEVVEVGDGVSRFKKGDRVFANTLGLVTGQPAGGAFQKYTVVKEIATALIPNEISFEKAVVLPLGMSTAAMGLFVDDMLGLQLPSTSPKQTGQSVLIWGGSSSVGSSAIQLAVAAGYNIFATASKANIEYCKKLGAKEVFDYKSSSIVGDLTAALKGANLAGAYDVIGVRDSAMNVAQVLAQLGGGKLVCTQEPPKDIPATVDVKQVFGPAIFLQKFQVGKALYEFLSEALKTGQIKPAPEPHVVGSGLEAVQTAIDKCKAGVSAAKVVITL